MSKFSEWVDAQPGSRADTAGRLGIKRVALHRLVMGQTMPSRETMAAIVRESAGTVTYADMAAGFEAARTAEPVAAV